MSHRHATAQNNHRRYSWVADRAAIYPIGSHCGSGRIAYAGLPACGPSAGALLVGCAWQVGSVVPRSPIAHPSDRMDTSFVLDLPVSYVRTPVLVGYALTIYHSYFFAKLCFR